MVNLSLTPDTRYHVEKLLRYAARQGLDVELRGGYRTCAEQNAIYDAGAGTATLARGCVSWHTWGRAVDLEIRGGSAADYALLGAKWKSWGGLWGGDFEGLDDPGHFEWHPGLKIRDVCPSPDGRCGVPPWPEDRPWFRLPAAQVVLGAVGVGAAVKLAYMLAKR